MVRAEETARGRPVAYDRGNEDPAAGRPANKARRIERHGGAPDDPGSDNVRAGSIVDCEARGDRDTSVPSVSLRQRDSRTDLREGSDLRMH